MRIIFSMLGIICFSFVAQAFEGHPISPLKDTPVSSTKAIELAKDFCARIGYSNPPEPVNATLKRTFCCPHDYWEVWFGKLPANPKRYRRPGIEVRVDPFTGAIIGFTSRMRPNKDIEDWLRGIKLLSAEQAIQIASKYAKLVPIPDDYVFVKATASPWGVFKPIWEVVWKQSYQGFIMAGNYFSIVIDAEEGTFESFDYGVHSLPPKSLDVWITWEQADEILRSYVAETKGRLLGNLVSYELALVGVGCNSPAKLGWNLVYSYPGEHREGGPVDAATGEVLGFHECLGGPFPKPDYHKTKEAILKALSVAKSVELYKWEAAKKLKCLVKFAAGGTWDNFLDRLKGIVGWARANKERTQPNIREHYAIVIYDKDRIQYQIHYYYRGNSQWGELYIYTKDDALGPIWATSKLVKLIKDSSQQ